MKNLADFLDKTTSITIDNSSHISKQYFNERYGYPGKPVNFKRAFQEMAIKSKWTSDYLAGILNEKVKLEGGQADVTPAFMNYKEYQETGTDQFYYKITTDLNSSLKQDYNVPEIFNCWYANSKLEGQKLNLSWFYVGNKGTGTPIHRDIWWSSAWNYLLSGKKLWLIYPPVYTESIKKDIANYQISSADVSYDKILALPYKPMVCVQEAGDLIFVPGNCYHQVINLENSSSLTENFMNETNYDLIRTYFTNGKNSSNLHTIEQIIKEGFTRMETISNN